MPISQSSVWPDRGTNPLYPVWNNVSDIKYNKPTITGYVHKYHGFRSP